ncbi:MAG: anhydro-N-acetylmuramic acid kinase [Chitinophagaceae bacterium]
MIYKAIGTMSGSSMDGLDVVLARFEEINGHWQFEILQSECIPFNAYWQTTLSNITTLSAKELLLAHANFGQWMGKAILSFIEKNELEHQVNLIASHGHTVFHEPQLGMTFQMGDGAHIASLCKLPVITDLRNMDVALGGHGAPIVPIGEKLLWENYHCFLNIGGIANMTLYQNEKYSASDICPANRILNALSQKKGLAYDSDGVIASQGSLCVPLLEELNSLAYYQLPAPKSLSNEFGLQHVLPLIEKYDLSIEDKMFTMCTHIVQQISQSLKGNPHNIEKMFITGGGAFNTFLIQLLQQELNPLNIQIEIPDANIVSFKEALVMALIGILRWREENNVLASATGSIRNSVGGALWMGQE